MKRALFQNTIAISFIIILAALASAQSPNPATPNPTPQAADANSAERIRADETFELNITERRITKHNLEASTSVEVGDESAQGLHLRIGVGVGAQEIDVLLREVHGSVRFHGSLDRVLQRINARRAPDAGP
jgi:hypothetical protein